MLWSYGGLAQLPAAILKRHLEDMSSIGREWRPTDITMFFCVREDCGTNPSIDPQQTLTCSVLLLSSSSLSADLDWIVLYLLVGTEGNHASVTSLFLHATSRLLGVYNHFRSSGWRGIHRTNGVLERCIVVVGQIHSHGSQFLFGFCTRDALGTCS